MKIPSGLILDIDPRKGSLIDDCGHSITNNGARIIQSDKGLCMSFSGVGGLVINPFDDLSGVSECTINQWIKPSLYLPSLGIDTRPFEYRSTTQENILLISFINASGANRLDMELNNVLYKLSDTTIELGAPWVMITLVYKGGQYFDYYKNGILTQHNITSIPSTLTTTGTKSLRIGDSVFGSNYYYRDKVSVTRVWNRVLSQSEINSLYYEFLNSPTIQPTTINFIKPKPTTLSENGLVAAYNMVKNGNVLYDISGNGLNGNVSGALSSLNGLKFDGVNDVVVLPTPTTVTTAFTLCMDVLVNSANAGVTNFISSTNAADACHYIGLNGGVIYWYNGSAYMSGSIDVRGKRCSIVYQFDGVTKTYKTFINGIQEMNQVGVGTSTNGILKRIGSQTDAGTTRPINAELYNLQFYNRLLSQSEIVDYHNSKIKPTLIEAFSNNGADNIAKGIQGWNITSGTWKINEVPPTRTGVDAMLYGTFDSIGDWNLGTGITISGGTCNINIASANGPYRYVTLLKKGKRYRITYTINSISSGTIFTRIGVDEFIGAQRTSAGTYSDEFVYAETNATWTNRFDLRTLGACVAVIDNVSIIEIPHGITELDNGCKYLECVTAGVISTNNKLAYGTWEFDWYKGNTNNDLHIYLALSGGNTMTFRAYTGEDIYMRFNGVGGFQTSQNYFQNNVWYRTKITRTVAGVTTCYIKGGLFGSQYTLVTISGTGSSGSNPVTQANPTVSNFLYLDFDAGDRIANIIIKDGIDI